MTMNAEGEFGSLSYWCRLTQSPPKRISIIIVCRWIYATLLISVAMTTFTDARMTVNERKHSGTVSSRRN